MPEEKKNEATEPDPTSPVDAIVTRASALKKAGLPTIVVLLITLASIPGVWSTFFDTTDDEAKVKAEVSYALLKAQSEEVVEMVKDNRDEVKALRDMVTEMLMQRSGRVSMTDLRLPPSPEPAPMMKALPETLDSALQSTSAGKEAMASAGLEASDINL